MRFIVDAQLPRKLSVYLNDRGHDSIHTLELPKKNATPDSEIAQLSLIEERIVITKDSDFYDRYLAKLEPYKILQISTGNISTKDLIVLFDKNLDLIIEELTNNCVVDITRNALVTLF